MLFKKERIHKDLDIRAPKIINRKAKLAASLIIKGNYHQIDFSACWQKLWAYIQEHRLFSMRMEFLGIYHDDPTITPESETRFEACITINKKSPDAEEVKVRETPEGNYLMFHYTGEYEKFREVYEFIYNDYLKDKDIKLRNAPMIEKYLNNPQKVDPKKLRTEILIPIE